MYKKLDMYELMKTKLYMLVDTKELYAQGIYSTDWNGWKYENT